MSLLNKNKQIVFVVGTGRSGTHLLARTLTHHDKTYSFIENNHSFNFLVESAAGQNFNHATLRKILWKYKFLLFISPRRFIIEKSHPNLWHVEEILRYIPKAKFVGIYRNPYGTVSSMLKHQGVLEWYNKLPLNKENAFLGIKKTNLSFFKDLPIESKCTYRWVSHFNRIQELKIKYPHNFKAIKYEDFYLNPDYVISELKGFLKLNYHPKIESLNSISKDKWKETLSKEQISNINSVLERERIKANKENN